MYETTAGSTSHLIDIFVQDSSVTTGAGLTGLLFNSAGLTCYYKRQGQATWSAVALATMTQGTYAAGGFKEGDATNAPGMYEFGIPNECIADNAGVTWVDFLFKGATNMAPVPLRILLKKVDFQAAYGRLPAKVDAVGISVLTSSVFATGAITASTFAANSITSTAIAQDAIDADALAENSIDASALAADAITEITDAIKALVITAPVAVPAAPYTLDEILGWLLAVSKFRRGQTATLETIYQDNSSTSLATSVKADNGTTFSRYEYE